jgi:hypothetical protein
MEELAKAGPELSQDIQEATREIAAKVQAGQVPDPEKLLFVSQKTDEAVDSWERTMARLRLSKDFQAREYQKMTEAHLKKNDQSVESLAALMRWQGQCMKAMADNSPPPMPPPGVDVQKLMEQSQNPGSMPSMTAPPQITAPPFREGDPVLSSATVKEEFKVSTFYVPWKPLDLRERSFA